MRVLLLSFVAVLAACGTQSQVPATTAPRHDTRVGLHDGFETLLLSTNMRTLATRDQLPGAPALHWPGLARAYSDLGVGIAHVDTATFVVGNPGLTVRHQLAGERLSKWLDCGRSPTGVPHTDRYNITLQIFTQLRPSSAGTEVRSVVTGRALSPTTNDPPIDCVSTGLLERRIVAGVAASAAG